MYLINTSTVFNITLKPTFRTIKPIFFKQTIPQFRFPTSPNLVSTTNIRNLTVSNGNR